MKNITHNLIDFCIKKSTMVYTILLIVTLVFCAQIARIQIDTDPQNKLDAEQPTRVFHNDIKTRFAMHDVFAVGVVNSSDNAGVFIPAGLTDIYDSIESIMSIEGVISSDLMSISTVDNIAQSQTGTIRFEWMMSKPPENAEQSEQIRQTS